MCPILIVGAYSPDNIGDGLLAELSVQIAYESTAAEIYLFALDVKGFRRDLQDNPQKYPGLLPKNIFSSLNIFSIVKILLRKNIAVIAIGGEYLIFSNFKSAAKSFVANGIPLFLGLLLNKPTGFFPQGIIVSKSLRPFITPILSRAHWILLRDSISLAELDNLNNVFKSSDLAILAIPPRAVHANTCEIIGIILHEVSDSEAFLNSARKLASLPNVQFFLQSDVGKNNRDLLFLNNTLGIDNVQSARNLYESQTKIGVLISTRLHGAIGAIRAGIPAIHIAYSRKGKAVFDDLGLSEYCINFGDMDVLQVIELAELLLSSTTIQNSYWQCITDRRELLKRRRNAILQLTKNLLE